MRVFLRLTLAISLLFLALSPRGVLADGFEEVEGKVVTHTLDNGLRVIILERHIAPVASFLTVVRVGSVDERPGITGIAHLFEHMAFKGTDTIGTTDYEKEMVAIQKVDEAYAALIKAKDRGEDEEKIEALQAEFKKLQDEASEFVVGEFDEVLQVNGGAGLNASTSSDRTMYVVSLPSNRVELWAALESERFLNPVLREFYKERDVVQEERRLRTDSSPFGRFREEFIAAAFRAHPYGWPVVGHMSDIQTVTREEGLEFYSKYYVASNMIVAIVGDVNPQEVIPIVEKYFGRLPKRPPPGRVETVEPPQRGERTVILEDPAQPLYAVGYHKPDAKHPDDIVFDVMSEILSSGRTSRLYKSLVKEQKIAVQVFSFSGSPGNRYPNLFGAYGVPASGFTADDVEKGILAEIERLKNEPVTAEELQKVKTRSRASVIRGLRSNMGMARNLAFFEDVTGDWKNLFRQVEKIDQLTPEDIQRVARKYLVRKNRTTAKLVTTREDQPSE